ncbi:MAG: hypothetical protein MJZ30_05885 [Paludibacteraceae bacterium]|nr:hypothetical protein [Paludibacteraceae bacterium]
MKTIEERTRDQEKSQFTEDELERLHKLHGVNSAFGIGYYLGATEQREIDIEKATEWLTKQFEGSSRITIGKYTVPVNVFIEMFSKAMKDE